MTDQERSHEARVRLARLRTLDEMTRSAAELNRIAELYYDLDHGRSDQGISGDTLARFRKPAP